MVSANDLVVSREESYVFFQVNCVPVHPLVLEGLRDNGSLDYGVMNESLDDALDWTYRDMLENPGLVPDKDFLSPIKDSCGEGTADIGVIRDWLEGRPHSYYHQENGVMYRDEDVRGFPFPRLRLADEGMGIYIGFDPVIVTYDQQIWIRRSSLGRFGKDEFLPPVKLGEFGIVEKEGFYVVPAVWYTKDAQPIIRLFGKNFGVNYNNRMIRERMGAAAIE